MKQIKKIDILINLMASNEWRKALSLAAKFPRLGKHKIEITRAHNAINNPSFYKQIKLNPDIMINKGIEALKERYKKYL